jgi:hypothetical protein
MCHFPVYSSWREDNVVFDHKSSAMALEERWRRWKNNYEQTGAEMSI